MATRIICDTPSPVMPFAYAREAGTYDAHAVAAHAVNVAINRHIARTEFGGA